MPDYGVVGAPGSLSYGPQLMNFSFTPDQRQQDPNQQPNQQLGQNLLKWLQQWYAQNNPAAGAPVNIVPPGVQTGQTLPIPTTPTGPQGLY